MDNRYINDLNIDCLFARFDSNIFSSCCFDNRIVCDKIIK